MGARLTATATAAFVAVVLIAASASAAMIGIYRNGMKTTAQRGQLVKLSGRDCARRGYEGGMLILVGKRTSECSYRTPVIGRDLEIAATERLLSGTPKERRQKAFLGLQLRAGGGARYQLAVFPLQRKVQLRKVLSDGSVKFLDVARSVPTIKGVGQANALRLSAINVTRGRDRGNCHLRGSVGGEVVVEATDVGAGDLGGRASAVSAGAIGNARGVLASVDNVVVRVPSPF